MPLTRFRIRTLMIAVAVVAGLIAAAQYWTTEEANRSRAYCFRASSDFAGYAFTLRYEAGQSRSANEKRRLESTAVDCDATSWMYWRLAFQPWADVPDNPFKSE